MFVLRENSSVEYWHISEKDRIRRFLVHNYVQKMHFLKKRTLVISACCQYSPQGTQIWLDTHCMLASIFVQQKNAF